MGASETKAMREYHAQSLWHDVGRGNVYHALNLSIGAARMAADNVGPLIGRGPHGQPKQLSPKQAIRRVREGINAAIASLQADLTILGNNDTESDTDGGS